MGKRELVLIIAFVALGAVLYRATAPPPAPGESRFSLANLFRHVRADVTGIGSHAQTRTSVRAAVGADIREVSVLGMRGSITLIGEDRSDIDAEVTTDVVAADPAEAEAKARQVTVHLEPAGEVMALSVRVPPLTPRYRTGLSLKVPRRLRVRLETSDGAVDVRNVAAVNAVAARGDAWFRSVAGPVHVEHRDGRLEVSDAISARLMTRRSEVHLARISGDAMVEATDGILQAAELRGDLLVEGRRLKIDVDGSAGRIDITNSDEPTRIRAGGGPIRFDGRRSALTLNLAAAVPVTASTTSATIDVSLPAIGGVTLDAIASSGTVRTEFPSTTVSRADGEEHATGPINGGGAPVSLRTSRGDIVIQRIEEARAVRH